MDNFKHDLFVLNSADGQILLVKSEGYTVLHGHLRPDGSMDFAPPTCFPSPPTGCADDYVLQTKTATSIPAYTCCAALTPAPYSTLLPVTFASTCSNAPRIPTVSR